jgi:peroxiredoxin
MLKACTLLASLVMAAEPDSPSAVKDFALPDTSGNKHTQEEWKGKKAVVMLFLGVDCPVSNFYCPEYARLVKAFTPAKVAFYGIHPDPYVTNQEAIEHAREYQLAFPIILDPRHLVTRQAGVQIVPQAVVLSPEGRILYRGRIDDRYNADGIRREKPQSRDLENALKAIIAGNKPPVAQTQPFGCPIPPPRDPK